MVGSDGRAIEKQLKETTTLFPVAFVYRGLRETTKRNYNLLPIAMTFTYFPSGTLILLRNN
jgi:hypothetical protein